MVRQGTREGHWRGCRRKGLTRAKTDPWKQQRDESSSFPPAPVSHLYFPWAKPNQKAGGQSTQVVSRIEAGLQGPGDAKDGSCGWKGKGLEQGNMSLLHLHSCSCRASQPAGNSGFRTRAGVSGLGAGGIGAGVGAAQRFTWVVEGRPEISVGLRKGTSVLCTSVSLSEKWEDGFHLVGLLGRQ